MKNAISHAYEIIEMAREIERLRFEVDRLQDIETKYQQLLDTSISHSEHMMGEMLTMAIELTKTEVLK